MYPSIPPEKRSEVQMRMERIRRATEMFETNFKSNGKPKTPEGKRLAKKYEYGSYYSKASLWWKLKVRWRRLIYRVFSANHRS